jgi:hypothetical protein
VLVLAVGHLDHLVVHVEVWREKYKSSNQLGKRFTMCSWEPTEVFTERAVLELGHGIISVDIADNLNELAAKIR